MKSLKIGNIGELISYNTEKDAMCRYNNVEIIIDKGKILEIGKNLGPADKFFDCKNKLVTPGFVDPHTHPIFYNSREDEFLMRAEGMSYEEISAKGGGILNSIDSLRNTSKSLLIAKVKSRMNNFLKFGTTTVECKSGYGLSTISELKSLDIINIVNQEHKIDMIPTFMGAHAFPIEYQNRKEEYVDLICNEMIPEVAKQGIAKFNDVFCENGYFDLDQTTKIINRGKKYNLYPRIHADEFCDSGAANLAGELKVVSADHLMAVSTDGIKSLSENDVVATLLPGTTFFLGKHEYAPYHKIKDSGISVALATDYNPGSCNIQSMPFIITLACLYLQMNILDAIESSTFIAAKSLMMDNVIGSIEKGKNADIVIWDFSRIEQLPYSVNRHTVRSVFKNGDIVFSA